VKFSFSVCTLLTTLLLIIPTPSPANSGKQKSTAVNTNTKIDFKPQEDLILNPDRGIYRFRPLTASSDFQSVRTSGATLIYAELNLAAFRMGAISSERLQDIGLAFDEIRKAGIKAIVRIVYASNIGEPDAPLKSVNRHLQQLDPIFERNKDIIFAFQAGVIGPWGEWHSSSEFLDSPESRLTVLRTLIKELPNNAQIHLRRPQFKEEYIRSQMFDPSIAERLGYHNDCLFASDTDSNTYPSDRMEAQKAMIHRDSALVAVGGETCRPNPARTRCPSVLKELANLGFTYLNADYHPDVIASLSDQGCWNTIVAKLGYRFELQSLTLNRANGSDGIVHGILSVRNVGWAPPYTNRSVVIRVRQNSKVVHQTTIQGLDIRTWIPASQDYTVKFTIPPLKDTGTYTISASLFDPSEKLKGDPRYSIQFANEGVWDDGLGENIIFKSPVS